MTDDWKARALRAEAEVVALKAALDDVLVTSKGFIAKVATQGHLDSRANAVRVLASGGGSDLLDAVRKAREALVALLYYYDCPDNISSEGREAKNALSRFLPEGT